MDPDVLRREIDKLVKCRSSYKRKQRDIYHESFIGMTWDMPHASNVNERNKILCLGSIEDPWLFGANLLGDMSVEAAEAEIHQLLSRNNTDPTYLGAKAVLACLKGQAKQALETFSAALVLNSSHPANLCNFANFLRDAELQPRSEFEMENARTIRKRKISEIPRIYKAALGLCPGHPTLVANYAKFKELSCCNAEALQLYRQADHLLPSDYALKLNLGRCAATEAKLCNLELSHLERCWALADQGIKYASQNSSRSDKIAGSSTLGYFIQTAETIAREQSDTEHKLAELKEIARRSLLASSAIDPSMPWPAIVLSGMYMDNSSEYSAAAEAIHWGMETMPDSAELLGQSARLKWLMREEAQAQELYTRALELDPMNIQNLCWFSQYLKETGRRSEALSKFLPTARRACGDHIQDTYVQGFTLNF
mmetsp:Transcript_32371/g.50439  ORF Transcript_32371/g.50439 Transcript_32371/m.50439 type:complete len:425 (-) Transcript_32371:88-1362(-)